MQPFRTSAALALCAITAACHAAETPGPALNSASVTGSVTYREQIALAPSAVFHVELLDVSNPEAAAIVLSERDSTGAGQVPIPFELPYDPAAIDPQGAYAVRARINLDGRLLFTTAAAVRVLTRDHPQQVEIVLVRPGVKPDK
jgi:putative lipoprotein